MLTNILVKFHDSKIKYILSYARNKLKIENFHLVKGNNSDKNINSQANSQMQNFTSHTDQYPCKNSWPYVKFFLSYIRHKLKIANFH
jgi:hypothetical protein